MKFFLKNLDQRFFRLFSDVFTLSRLRHAPARAEDVGPELCRQEIARLQRHRSVQRTSHLSLWLQTICGLSNL